MFLTHESNHVIENESFSRSLLAKRETTESAEQIRWSFDLEESEASFRGPFRGSHEHRQKAKTFIRFRINGPESAWPFED